jgi:hypothetical protein
VTATVTVVGKVTHMWPDDTTVINLYRRSLISSRPRTFTLTWGMQIRKMILELVNR